MSDRIVSFLGHSSELTFYSEEHVLCCCFHIYEIFFVTLLYCSQAKYFHYSKWATETLVRNSVSEIGDFPSYVNQMIANYFYRVMMPLSMCVV